MTLNIAYIEGHGKGSAWNRGGLYFNEGDENYNFAGLQIKEWEKYNNVIAKGIRHEKGNVNHTYYNRVRYQNGKDIAYLSHSNAFKPNVRGVEIILSFQSMEYYNFAVGLAKLISETLEIPNRGVKFRNYKTGAFIGKSQAKSTMTNWYAELRGSKAKCSMLVEHFFHTNEQDSKSYLAKRELLAKKIVEYIAKNFKVTKKATETKTEVKPTTTVKPTITSKLYEVTADTLHVRADATVKSKIVGKVHKPVRYTIVEEKNGWGKLKSGLGWISLKYCELVKEDTQSDQELAMDIALGKGEWKGIYGVVRTNKLKKMGKDPKKIQALVDKITSKW